MSGIFLQQALTGFLVKSIASFDDTLTRIPLLAEITRRRAGKVAFSLGTLLALTVILLVVMFFSNVLEAIPNRRLLVAGLILAMAVVVYLGLLSPTKEEKIQHQLIKQSISHARFVKLIAAGFVISFITYLDDMIVLIPLFLDGDGRLFTLLGVYLAALVQIIMVIYFSRQIAQIKYKKEVASLSLVVLATLVWWGVI